MIGGQYNTFPYARPLAVAQFTQDTHSPAFNGRTEVRDWAGGHIFYRLQDFLDYFRSIAIQNNFSSPADGINCTTDDLTACTYDPTQYRAYPSQTYYSDLYNEFETPDARRWSWAYISDNNTWVAVDRDRNTASYVILRTYNADVVHEEDDGNIPGLAYADQLPIKYFLYYFEAFNYGQQ